MSAAHLSTETAPGDGLLERFAPVMPVGLCPELVAHQAPDVHALWRAWEEESGVARDVPYWATVWPAAQVLARAILDGVVEVAGAHVVEIGAGGAIVSIASARRGAHRVCAVDIDPHALAIARRNALLNSAAVETVVCDSGDIAPITAGAQVVLVADMFYEREASARLRSFLDDLCAREVRVYVADSGRPFAGDLALDVLVERDVAVNGDLEGVAVRRVRMGRWVNCGTE